MVLWMLMMLLEFHGFASWFCFVGFLLSASVRPLVFGLLSLFDYNIFHHAGSLLPPWHMVP